MMHHEESLEKPQYHIETPPFLDNPPPDFALPPFSSKNFQTPSPFPSILKKSHPSPPAPTRFMKGGIRTMQPRRLSFPTGLVKTESDFTVRLVETDLGR